MRELDAAARKWEPTLQDALTALVVMTPTMSEYFEAWKNSRFVAGEPRDGEGVRGRLAAAGHHRHPRRAWCWSTTTCSRRSPRPTPSRRARPQAACERLHDFAARLRDAERDGAALHRPGRRHARLRRPGPGRGDRRPDLPGRRPAEHRARDLAARRCAALRLALLPPRRRHRAGRRGGSACAGRRRRPPWRAAEQVRAGLLDAQSELILGSPRRAQAGVARARSAYRRIAGPIARADRRAAAAAVAALADAQRAVARRRPGAPGSRPRRRARGAVPRQLRGRAGRGATAATRRAPDAGCSCASSGPPRASRRPGADATLAVGQPRRPARCLRAQARQAVAKDLLDAYQARLRELLDDAARGRRARAAEPPRRGRRPGRRLLRDPRRALPRGPRARRRDARDRRVRSARARRAARGPRAVHAGAGERPPHARRLHGRAAHARTRRRGAPSSCSSSSR